VIQDVQDYQVFPESLVPGVKKERRGLVENPDCRVTADNRVVRDKTAHLDYLVRKVT